MSREKFRANLEFDKKIRLAGVICSAVCLAVRQIVFPESDIPALVMLIPLGISIIFGLVKMLSISPDYLEGAMDDCKQDMMEFNEKNAAVNIIVDIGTVLEIAAAVAIMIFGW